MKDLTKVKEYWDIRPCVNGVGSWEVFDDTGSVHETFDTRQEAEIAKENYENSKESRL
tara:strand:+ start:597 stop:770 length:174 start_codon:yes stop_codon:yes gene_type:complete